jgi:LPS-assembly protein
VLIPLLLVTLVAGGALYCAPAEAQVLLQFPPRPKQPAPQTRRTAANAPMLLQATEIQYDYTNRRVSAVGTVQIYHRGTTLEADRVVYDETTKRLHAEGNVRLTEGDGQVTYGEIMNLSEDFRDGFVDSLRLDTAEQTRMAAARADRTDGNFTVFQSGVYTACEPCKDDPKKPPLWQIKGARIIHDEGEKMIYFENAQLEFFGYPAMYMPYFSAPDPTVKRKSGFLFPLFGYSTTAGFSAQIPYYWALAPDYDLTLTPRLMSRQGLLMMTEWRQRLVNGGYSIRVSGLHQEDKDYFIRSNGTVTPGYRDWRGHIDTSGQFALSDTWTWGWDALLPSDATYLQDYGIPSYQRGTNTLIQGLTEGISQLYIVGAGNRSYFSARGLYYYGFSEADTQKQIPIVLPVVDYRYTVGQPVLGGELSYRANLTSINRQSVSYDTIVGPTAFALGGSCAPTADPAAILRPGCFLLRGVPGSYTRFSAEAQWKRSYTDSFGQIFTPFALLRADTASINVENQPGVSNYGLALGNSTEYRMMPVAGAEYRYPFISVQSWGTQTIEPIAQIIVRPNEQRIGKLPNEDAQSLIFDDSNLFRLDKFSGWDRVEGGGRANVGIQYTAQVNRGGFFNAMFGQSYHLFGTNSFAVGDSTNTGLNSGLDTSRSDYVARLSFQPDRVFTFTTRYRFDQQDFSLQRFEVEGRVVYDRWNVAMIYGRYAAQPLIGFLTEREGILGQAQVRLSTNWVATALATYDIDARKLSATQFGIGYIDDCIILALNYITSYQYSGTPASTLTSLAPDRRIVLQLSLRTLGTTTGSQALSPQPAQ